MNLSAEFEKWGRVLVIENTDSTRTASFKGFIQPLRYKNKMYLYGVNTEIGYKYQIVRAVKIKLGEEVLYVWAVVRTVVEITE